MKKINSKDININGSNITGKIIFNLVIKLFKALEFIRALLFFAIIRAKISEMLNS